MQPKRAPIHAQLTQPIRAIRAARATHGAVVPRPGLAAPNRRPTNSIPPGFVPRVAPPLAHLPRRPLPARRHRPNWWLIAPLVGAAIFVLMACAAVTLFVGLTYSGGILPGVHVGGLALGGLSETAAVQKLRQQWNTITVRDGERQWTFAPAVFGLTLDAQATAKLAYAQGRQDFASALPGIVGRIDVAPVISMNADTAQAALQTYAGEFEQAPVNAGVRLVDGRVEATEPENGRVLDIVATMARLRADSLANGTLELVMRPVQPTVTDATPLLEQASRLLASPLDIRAFDPVTGNSVYWSVSPQEWGNWLSAEADANSPTGLSLSLKAEPTADYLNRQAASVFDQSRYLKTDEAVSRIQQAVIEGQMTTWVRVYHHDRQHVVQPGETITSIAWDYGVPYLYIQQTNGGLDSVSAGQTITIPSPDNFLPFPVNPDKRIVVSISQQRTWVYENGSLKWEWLASTGISSSPTWPGIYQIISHELNAYAGNWNLWMPNFMGVYKPIPGADFTNGFHGFPTRGGGQLLWENNLGTRVTYGCILLSTTNAQALYAWAEEGVVVEIQA